ncbi:TonB-dependent receptor [Pedobacter faecalis]|uniref:TonB-dependent receptor n=1 Tax=Pedobacter faecalis TaxID=3041495 RepID=UPI00254D295C|nr:TonB-dependent receptor [Pedobacter sp. ELA7]
MNQIRFLGLCVVFMLIFEQSHAQTYTITGYIYDSQTQQPLAGVNIDSLGVTDRNGHFEFTIGATQTFRVSLVGYKTQLIKVVQSQRNYNIQLEADAVRLNEVRVAGANNGNTIRETPGAVSVVTATEINRGNGVSLQQAFNGIPGVRMDQSTLSEARISIRGNGIRASFGNRNIRIYVNEIPVTEADGTTRIEALDVNSIGRAEVIRGPGSSVYGAGTGGVINFQLQRSPYQEQSIEGSTLFGDNGLRRIASAYRSGGDKMNGYVSYGWQEYDGYRSHSSDMRRFLTGNFQLFPDNERLVTLLINRTTQYSQIPGALTAAQVSEDPRQANLTNVEKQAGRYQNWTRVGLGQKYLFSDRLSNSSSVYTYFYDLNHPLAFAYIRNFYQSYGGRTRFNYEADFPVLPTRFTIGAEFNEGLTKGSQYVNNNGTEGALNTQIDYRNLQYAIFYQSETMLSRRTALTIGMSYNKLSYDVSDYLKPTQSGVKAFEPQFSPRLALSHTFGEALSLHASLSSGFSPPTGSEIRNADGSINGALKAERGMNYEINAKGNLGASRVAYDLALFMMNLKGELIGQTISQGITVYNNAGKTDHDGIELSLSYQLLREEDNSPIMNLRPYAAVTYADFKFRDYKVINAQNVVTATYDGNKLTGVSPWVIDGGVDLEMRNGFYMYGSCFYSDRLPVNDANTNFNGAYTVLSARLGYKKRFARHFEANIYGGVDNLLNRNYSSIFALNAAGFGGSAPAYYNPSPLRAGYGGLNLKYNMR